MHLKIHTKYINTTMYNLYNTWFGKLQKKTKNVQINLPQIKLSKPFLKKILKLKLKFFKFMLKL